MTDTKKTILVLGATGRQGGATAHHLLKNGWHVRALTRDANQPAAQALKSAGAEVIQGDYDSDAVLNAALQGVYGVFSVQAYGGTEAHGEVDQGKAIADAAKATGVKHLVYTSVQSAEDLFRIGGDGNKWEIEEYIRSLNVPYTIIRPCLFMDDLLVRYGVAEGEFRIGFGSDVSVGLIAAYDIGAFAAYAFDHPTELFNQTLEIASDILTPHQIAETISRVLSRSISYVQVPLQVMEDISPRMARAFEFLNEVGYQVDMDLLRQQNPDLLTLEAWLIQFALKTQAL